MERVEQYKSMYAYSGSYRVEGDKLILLVDGSWSQSWAGTQRVQVARSSARQR